MAFFVGSKLDVKYESIWYIATIIEATENKIKVHYDCDGDDDTDDHWIDVNSDTVAKLYAHTIPINSLQKTPETTQNKVFTIYYTYDGNKYIILCANAIFRYDITTDNWSTYSEYPGDFYANDIDVCVDDVCFDTQTFNLHLLYMSRAEITIATFNVIDHIWNVSDYDIVTTGLEKSYLAYTSENELHTFTLERHYKIFDGQCTDVVDVSDDELSNSSVVWCEALRKLVKANGDSIFVCDVECKQNEYYWTKLDIEMDATHLQIDIPLVILAYKYIIFAFCSDSNKICCIDLLHEKWYKISKYIAIGADTTIVKGDGNYVYLTDCDYETFERISLLNIIPDEMQLFWEKKISNPLIFGYINMISKESKLSNSIPYDIVNLILAFYPTFCD